MLRSADSPRAPTKTSHSYDFAGQVFKAGLDLKPTRIDTLQINITKLCNQACVHCHVDASPRRREMMPDAVVESVLAALEHTPQLTQLDITGGAPELHPRFREIVRRARALGKHVMVRHNLTVMMDPHPLDGSSLADLPEFFAEQQVEVISSLPYHHEFLTDKQRGSGVFKKSMAAMRALNEQGYGREGSGLVLNLVYNPVGAYLPAAQSELERDYKRELQLQFGLSFNQLFTITNMPIHRFKAQLQRTQGYEEYMERLQSAFNPAAATGIMCRSLISVAYDGRLFDCDFNQMLDLPLEQGERPAHMDSFDLATLQQRTIATADHCYGCTAGAGSSCGGNTV